MRTNLKKEIYNLIFMDLESRIIKLLSLNNKYIGDDCAYIKETKQLISTDTLVENTHFDLKYFNVNNITHRLFISNFSDIQSSGGIPRYALFNISFPKKKFEIALSISKKLKSIANKHNVNIIGGDTTNSDKISLTLTLISKKIEKSDILLRSKAKINDDIFVFKNLGFSKLGFLNIYNNLKLPNKIKYKSKKQFLSPKFYKYYDLLWNLPISSSMDISDSLYECLIEMSFLSKKKFIIENLKGVNPYLHNYINSDDKYHNLILGSGEEYTPIFTLPKNILDNKSISLFKKRGIKLERIGYVSKGKGVEFKNLNIKGIKLFNHFNKNYKKI